MFGTQGKREREKDKGRARRTRTAHLACVQMLSACSRPISAPVLQSWLVQLLLLISAPLLPSWLAQLLLLQRRARRTRPARLACVQMLSACSGNLEFLGAERRSNKVENSHSRRGKTRVCNFVSLQLRIAKTENMTKFESNIN